MYNDILVSIKCLVYNHALFLRDCLDGFIMQKTNFRFEVIIHDDASTDVCLLSFYMNTKNLTDIQSVFFITSQFITYFYLFILKCQL